MKLKKGSKAAKDFMAKIRRMKGKPKKTKLGAVKRSTRKVVKKNTSVLGSTQHNDTKSHNYKISISGTENAIKLKAKELYHDSLDLYGRWFAALFVAKTKADKNIIKKKLAEIKSEINHYKKFIK